MKEKKPSITKLAVISEALSNAGPERFGCQECGLCRGHRSPFSMPFVPKGWTKKLLIVGVEMSSAADKKMITKWARKSGYQHEDLAYMNPLRCGTFEPSMKQLRACRPFLLRVIDRLQPEAMLAFGPDALRALTNDGSVTNIMHTRGTQLVVPGATTGAKAFCTYHPSSVMNGGTHYEPLVLEDFNRLTWPELPWPEEFAPQGDRVGLDTEFTPAKVLTVATSDARFARTWDLEAPSILKDVKVLIGQSIFTDVDSLIKIGQPVREEWVRGIDVRDSLLLARMVDENRGKGGYDVETLLRSSFNVKPWKHKTDDISESDPTLWPLDLRNERCRLDAWGSVKLVEKYEPLARGPVEFTHQIAASLHRLRHTGVMLDAMKLEEIAGELYADRNRAKDLLLKTAMEAGMSVFEPTNDEHIRELLFDRLKLEVISTTKKEGLPSVDKTTLTFHKGEEVVGLLTQFNQADKLCGLIDGEKGIRPNTTQVIQTEDDALLHLPVNINPLAARTARRASSRPNMQNWKPKMRKLVRSRWKGGVILDCDYRSLEPFILGWTAKDEKYFEYFKQGKGYVGIAKEVYKQEIEKGTREYKVTKGIVLGTNYGAGGKKIGEQLWFEMGVKLSADFKEHVKIVSDLKKRYLNAFPGIKRFMNRQKNELLTTGQIVTLTDRVRHMPVPQGEDTPGFGHFLNSAYNYPIQSLASDVTGSAIIDVEEALCNEYGISAVEMHKGLLSHEWPEMPLLINEVHDELVFDVPPMVNQEQSTELILEMMKSVPTLRRVCPAFTLELGIEHLIAPTWGEKS